MDCLMHQVLVAMLAVTPAADLPAAAKGAEIKPRPAVSAPVKQAKAKTAGAQVTLGKKSKTGAQLAQVTVPRPAEVN